ncbi:portal protein [Arthrobacter phage Noely]|uniref:Portal protein n=1 Tax=Arthrobacter phage Noely TaxID=2419964 RepID=A0A3G2KAC1_9CAUD|nr:portal protein [Arthrobacter phage Noely]AYN55945.1 portal protein [Arthrobacter phage Noely]
MPRLFDTARTIMGWTAGSLDTGASSLTGVTWATSTALDPILPPSLPRGTVSVADALRCPPVARGVGLYSAAFLKSQWTASDNTLAWLNKASGPVSPEVRNVRTLVDLVMANRALWITSGTGTARGEAVHLYAHLWTVDEAGVIRLGGVAPDAAGDYVVGGRVITNVANLIYFPGAMPMGFLDAAEDSLTYYKDLAATIKSRGKTPMPLMELKILADYDGPMPGDPDYDEATDLILNTQKGYAAARSAPDGAVTVTPKDVDLIVHQPDDDGGMLIEARNAVRVDVANHLNINASMLDGNTGGSDDYANTLQKRNEFEDLSLALFTAPILARLSLDDVTPPGERVDLVPFDSGPDAAGNTGDAVGTLQSPAAGLGTKNP